MTPPMPRRFLSALEPISASIFFSPEMVEEYTSMGLDAFSGYFCTRAAPMGPVSADVVAATFYNFNPELVRRNVRWDLVSPERALEARHGAIRRTLERLLLDENGRPPAGVDRAIELLREGVAACPPHGRPLAAAHASLPWPDDRLTALWHGTTVLREFRGDGHIAVLLAHGIGPVEAIILQAAYQGGSTSFLQVSRQWDDATMARASAGLADRGFLAGDGSLTAAGQKFRLMIEGDTDRIAAEPFNTLGPERCEELLDILTPMAETIIAKKGAPRFLGRMDPAHPVAGAEVR